MLSKKYRLTTKEVIKVNRKGVKLNRGDFSIKYLPNNLGYSRFAINIPQKVVKKAVIRNKHRRKIFDYLDKDKNKSAYDILINIYKDSCLESFEPLLANNLKKIYV